MSWSNLDADNKRTWFRARDAYNYIMMYEHGCPQVALKKFFGLTNGNYESLMLSMEFHGFLVSQDNNSGKLYAVWNRALR